MPTVFKMPNRKFWFAQITRADGTRAPRKSTKTTSKREATKLAADWEAEERKKAAEGITETRQTHRHFARIVENAGRLAEDGKLTLDRAEGMICELRRLANPAFADTGVADFWSALNKRRAQTISKSTADNQANALTKWLAAMPKAMGRSLAALTPADIHAGLTAMTTGDKAIAASTAKNYVKALISALDAAVDEKLLATNPARSDAVKQARKRPMGRRAEKVGPFTAAEVKKLASTASGEWEGMVLFGFYTGLRMGDIAALGQANIDGDTLVVRSAKTGTETKTPLHPQLVEWTKGTGDKLFPKISAMDPSKVSRQFSELMAKAGIPRAAVLPGGEVVKRSFHSLRHSFASTLANANVSPELRMKLTGHATSTVHSGYTHHDQDVLTAAIALLPTI
jgi:integrase